MGRIKTFILGAVVGGLAVYGSLLYHVLRAESGFHFIAKTSVSFGDIYVDVREFNTQDWLDHPDLATAVMRSGKHDLIQGSAVDAVSASVQQFLAPRD